jgi:hypothetical protein
LKAAGVDMRELDLRSFLTNCLLENSAEMEARGFIPDVRLPPLPLTINADMEMLCRVMQNLLSNTIKHGKDIISICAEQDRGKGVCIRVENRMANKGGIDITRVFDRFYTSNTSRGLSSTGLGLAITKLLVQKCGVRLTVQQCPGVGVPGIGVDLLRASLLHDAAVLHDGDAVAEIVHLVEVVGDKEHPQTQAAVEVPKQVEYLGPHGYVQGAERLVGDDKPGPQHKGAADADPLFLPHGKLVGLAVFVGGVQAHQFQNLVNPSAPFRPAPHLVYP